MYNIPINDIEYKKPTSRTRKAYRQLIDTRNQYIFNQIDLKKFLDQTATIIFNQVPVNDLIYFKSIEGAYFTIFELLVNSETSKEAAYRLKTDLLTVY